jgi:hypothetical protein
MDAGRVRTTVRNFFYQFIILAGALACVLVWLKIEPKDLLGWHVAVTLPHWLWLAVAIVLFVVGMVPSGYSLYRSLQTNTTTLKTQPETQSPKLVIHRAAYAAGLMTEVSVTDKLKNATRDALVVIVDHTLGGLLPNDPAYGVPKRLDVEYSYGSDRVFRVSRMERPAGEICRLLLPEDSEVQRLTNEVGRMNQEIARTKQRSDEFQNKFATSENKVKELAEKLLDAARFIEAQKEEKKPDSSLRARIIAKCDELSAFSREHGPGPVLDRNPGESAEEYISRKWREQDDYSGKMGADFRLKLAGSVEKLRNEIQARSGMSELGLDKAIAQAESRACTAQVVDEMSKLFWNFASTM